MSTLLRHASGRHAASAVAACPITRVRASETIDFPSLAPVALHGPLAYARREAFSMSEEPFFERDGSAFVPQPPCRGPWDPKSLNGRVVVALCGWQIEQSHELAEYMPARLTV